MSDNVVALFSQLDKDAIALNFFEKVLPSSGLYCAAVKKRGGEFGHTFHETYESLWTKLRDDDRSGHAAYFAPASFASNQDRTKENVAELKCFRVDLDFGQGHTAPGYETLKQAHAALKEFCEAVNIPVPMPVLSGGGLHAYWVLKEPLSRAKWQPYAEGLKAACLEHGLRADGTLTANAAAILRPPGTTNRKLSTPRNVELPHDALLFAASDIDLFEPLLKYAAPPPKRTNLTQTLPPRPKYLGASEAPAGFADLVRLAIIAVLASECGQVARFQRSGDLPEPVWMLLAAIFRFVEDGERLFHEWSKHNFPRYNRAETQSKYDRTGKLTGPALCSTFQGQDEATRAICLACPHVGAIATPIDAGVQQALPEIPAGTQGGKAGVEPKKPAFVEWDLSKENKKLSTYKNAAIALGQIGVVCRHDTFHLRKMVNGVENIGPMLDDASTRAAREMIITRFKFDPGETNVCNAMERECERNPFDPIADYLEGLSWDTHSRLDYWLSEYLGAENTPVNRAFGRKTLLAAVRRVYQPGCKFDHLLVLEGKQGAGKSSAWRALAGDENFSDAPIRWDDPRQQREASGGIWIHELAELVGMRKADVEAIKSFLSRQNDRNRAAYDRYPTDQQRKGIFVGTVNPQGAYAEYLTDPTGARRFWPVKINRIDLKALAHDRDQLWAEAAHFQAKGEPLELPSALYDAAAREQDFRRVADPWLDMLADLRGAVENGVERAASADILTRDLGVERARITSHDASRLGGIMRRLGWNGPMQTRLEGKTVRGYERIVA